jgi:7,8-didemethyl-8-hydroxy-5-deazariboflavin synthase CofH subunit
MISFCRRARIGGRLTELGARRARAAGATVLERPNPSESDLSHALAGGLLTVATGPDADRALAWIAEPDAALALQERGAPGWRITVAAHGAREQILDAVVRSGAAFLRAAPERLDEALAVARLPGVETAVSLEVADLDQAVGAVRSGVSDLVLDDWGDEAVGELRVALAPARLAERTAFPLGLEVDDAREALDRPALKAYLDQIDAHGAARPRYAWAPGKDVLPPVPARRLSAAWADRAWREGEPADGLNRADPRIADVLQRALDGTPPTRDEIETLFSARDEDVEVIARVADELRRRAVGDTVTYVINRNINYTNQCYFRCGFCGFSKGPKSLNHRGEPYMLEIHEVVHRSVEAWEQGATEVCLQGGIHPDYTGDFYVGVLEAIKARLPQMHVHGFTPLEVWQGAHTLGVSVNAFLTRLRDAGLGTLPGTAAEVLDDAVRVHLCPDKIRTAEWAEVMITAHELGLRATSTLMCGHIDSPRSWANHVEVIREIQRRTGGFTEFVPLPFVHMGSPIYLQGRSRPGPTWDEVVLVHAVPRIAFDGLIPNIQASWVKLGLTGGARLLEAGCNDLGGTLMNENISRASGAAHGQLATPQELEAVARAVGRIPARRSTIYEILEIPA